jgi:Family of unknown function (DUF5996)
MPTRNDQWPSLDYPAAKDALEALHMQTQVVGKVKLALTPTAPEWQNVPLWVNSRGLTTGLMAAGDRGLEIAFDLVDHRLNFTTTDGRREGFDLVPQALREFTAGVMAALSSLGVSVTINPMTVEVPHPVRCDEHEGCDAYDPNVAGILFKILVRTATILEEYRAGYWGKQSRAGLYWGTFDLSVARYNLVAVAPEAGADVIRRVTADSQQAEFGFWPGSERYPRPAFFAFTFPKPDGLENARIAPQAAGWNAEMGEFIFDYDDVRASDEPRAAILEFANSTYAAGADLLGWDRSLLDKGPPI